MHRLIKIFLLLTPLFLVSCLDVVEEVDLKADGSGVATYTFNLSQSKMKLNAILRLDSIRDHKVPKLHEIEAEFAKAVQELKSKAEIVDASYTVNESEYIYTLKISFTSLNSLSKALKEMSYWEKSEWKPTKDFYQLEGNIITKNIEAIILSGNNKKELEQRKQFLELGNYTFILRSNKEFQLKSSSELKLSGNKKAVMYRNDLYKLGKKGREIVLRAKVL